MPSGPQGDRPTPSHLVGLRKTWEQGLRLPFPASAPSTPAPQARTAEFSPHQAPSGLAAPPSTQ